MEQFKHTPDNQIIVNDLVLTLEEFLSAVPDYKLQEGFRGSEYIKGKFHRLYTSNNEIYLDKEWAEGDLYISMYEGLKATFGRFDNVVRVGDKDITEGELVKKQVETLTEEKVKMDERRKKEEATLLAKKQAEANAWSIEQKKILAARKEAEKKLMEEQTAQLNKLSSQE